MIVFAGALVAFAVFSVVVLRIARAEAGRAEATGMASGLAAWLLYLFHADTVGAAAFTDLGRLPAPELPFLVIGGTAAALGFALFLAATVTLVRHGGFEGLRTSQLVSSGPFRLCRHPQNAGWALMLLGIAIASRSVIALLFVAVFAVFSARLAHIEELGLLRRFGTRYASYRDRTPAFPGSAVGAVAHVGAGARRLHRPEGHGRQRDGQADHERQEHGDR